MNNNYNIAVELREEVGTSACRRLRRSGITPAVIYGHGEPARSVSLAELDAKSLIHHTGLVTINCNKESIGAIVKDVQLHPIFGYVLNIDFQEVKLDEIVESHIPVESTGTPTGTQNGGKLEQITHELHIKGVPSAIVDVITVDVSELAFDQVWHAEELTLPEGLSIASHADAVVFQCKFPGGMSLETEEEAEVATESTEA